MATPFSRTLRSIGSDGFRTGNLLTVLWIVLLSLWTVWFVRARVEVVQSSPDARIALEDSRFSLESPVAGRVQAVRLELGREVRAGEPLVELESADLALEEAEEEARVRAARDELVALEAQRSSEERVREGAPGIRAAAQQEARLRRDGLELGRALAEEEVRRLGLLEGDGIVSELDLVRAKSELESRRLALELHDAGEARSALEEQRSVEERETRRLGLEREMQRQRGLIAAGEAHLERLALERAQRRILAPRDGRIAEALELEPGATVQAGTRLGVLVAPGELAVLADFEAGRALGRILPGQTGRLRLDGFPWSRHGTLALRVVRVGGEAREGRVRVELALESSGAAIPLQHGLPGSVEIVVERVAPVDLVLRAAGLSLAALR